MQGLCSSDVTLATINSHVLKIALLFISSPLFMFIICSHCLLLPCALDVYICHIFLMFVLDFYFVMCSCQVPMERNAEYLILALSRRKVVGRKGRGNGEFLHNMCWSV